MKKNELNAGKSNGNGLTELVFILDRSGSMHGLEDDTVGGFNSLIEKQKAQEGECFVTTVLFNNESETLHDRIPLAEVPEMRAEDFRVGGCTALLDAIGGAVEHVAAIHKYARKDDVPEHVVFAIMTDGMENASRRFTAKQVKREIEKRRELGWEFLFLGANIDAVETAESFGIDAEKAVNYHADKRGTGVAFMAFSRAVGAARKGEVCADWREELDEDFNSRG